MFKDDVIEVMPDTVSLITLQLFGMELEHVKKEHTCIAYMLMEQLMDDWCRYLAVSDAPDKQHDKHLIHQRALMQTVSVFIDALKPSVKKKLAKQLRQETSAIDYAIYQQNGVNTPLVLAA